MRSRKQWCHVAGLAGNLIVTSFSETRDRILIFNGHVVRLPAGVPAAEIGEAVLAALGASKTRVRHPTDWSAFNRSAKVHLERVGISSFARLSRASRLVSVCHESGTFTVMPHEFGGIIGPDRGHHALPDRAVRIRSKDVETLGVQILRGLELCC